MNKVLLPANLEVRGTDPVSTVTLSLLEPETQVKSLLRPLTHLCWDLFCGAFLPFSDPSPVPSTPDHTPFLLAGHSLQLDLPSRLHMRSQVIGGTWGDWKDGR